MPRYGRLLTDAQWEKIRPLLPKPARQSPWRVTASPRLQGAERHPVDPAKWRSQQDLPDEFPHASTWWRRLRDWEEQGIWLSIRRVFLAELNERQQLKWREFLLDGRQARAPRGVPRQQNAAQQSRATVRRRHSQPKVW